MTGKGHTITGIIISLAVFKFTKSFDDTNVYHAALALLFTIIGSTAPDWMEIRTDKNTTFIPHRTWTHWLPLWVLLFIYSYNQFNPVLLNNLTFLGSNINSIINFEINTYLNAILLGFSIGGLSHLLFDLPNHMGIPILTPYHRFSLKLWKSGKYEYPIYFVTLLATLHYLNAITFNTEMVNAILK